jgi:hypothetical protein
MISRAIPFARRFPAHVPFRALTALRQMQQAQRNKVQANPSLPLLPAEAYRTPDYRVR